ncbi:MAG: uracil phosphoribosyltransferase [Treponema sp.]|jgi:uracil phosphoribosyltransferase|nr:uracil phosphoribosyltransferase [Treponema sp.]
MSIISLDVEKNSELESLITVCRSDSHINGLQLRKAHYGLGKILAKRMINDLLNDNITLVVLMRAGLCFGMGIADELEELGKKISVLFYSDEKQWNKEKGNWIQILENDIVLIDAVINTGDIILKLSKTMKNSKKIFFASNVLSEKAVYKFENKFLYTIRISEKSFKGSKMSVVKDGKGPDTGDRLFTQYELFSE